MMVRGVDLLGHAASTRCSPCGQYHGRHSLYMLTIATARRRGVTMRDEHEAMDEDVVFSLSLSPFPSSLSLSLLFLGGVVNTLLLWWRAGAVG